MKVYTAYIGLGANLGERHLALRRAAEALSTLPQTTVIQHSSIYETEPYGRKDQPRFLNAVSEIETALMPAALLQELKQLEHSLGRTHSEHWGPREIDLDILLYDGLVYSDDRVQVPHADLEARKFALVPLREIAPDVIHPQSGMMVSELLATCPDTSRVVKTLYRMPL